MQLLVYEFLCATADAALPPSLAREGRAMLAAVVEDFARLPDVTVTTLWAETLEAPPFERQTRVETIVVPAGSERASFLKAARECDAAFVIAPECDGLLAERFDWVAEADCRWLGSSRSAIQLCTDKLELSRWLTNAGIATFPTQPWAPGSGAVESMALPAVIKPRDGAGSQATFLIRDREDYLRILPAIAAEPTLCDNAIWQPYVMGDAVSVAMIMGADDSRILTLPVCRQGLSDDGRFHYLGGSVPANITNPERIQQAALTACRAVPGLSGYVGVDLILPRGDAANPVVVEINPRLTTSYLGYRRLTKANLGAAILGTATEEIRWSHRPVSFDVSDESH